MASLKIKQQWFYWGPFEPPARHFGGAIFEIDGTTPVPGVYTVIISNDDTRLILFQFMSTPGRWDWTMHEGSRFKVGIRSRDGFRIGWLQSDGSLTEDWETARVIVAGVIDQPNAFPMKSPVSRYQGYVEALEPVSYWRLDDSNYRDVVLETVPVGYWRLGERNTYRDEVMALGPSHYWRCGETSGNLADEMSTFSLYPQSAPTYGVIGALAQDPDKAMTFNGTTQYAAAGGMPAPTVRQRTLAAWFKTAVTVANNQSIVADRTPYSMYLFVGSTGPLGCTVIRDAGTNLSVVSGAVSVADGAWHFGVATCDGTTTALYCDGVLIGSTLASVAEWTNTPTDTRIGFQAGGSFFTGSIDEPAVFDRALTAGEIAALYAAGTTAVVTAKDEMGLNDGTYVGVPMLGAPGALIADDDTAVAFAGSQYVPVGAGPSIADSGGLTVVGWVKPTDVSGSKAIITKFAATPNSEYQLYRTSGGAAFQVLSDAGGNLVNVITGAIFATGQWTMVAASVVNGGAAKVYADGVEVASGTMTAPRAASAGRTQIGARDGALTTNDTLDEVAVWDRALNDMEIKRMFAAGRGGGQYARDNMGRNHGTYVGSPDIHAPGGLVGDVDTAVALNGSSQYVQSAGIPNATGTMTVSAWLKSPNGAMTRSVVGSGISGTDNSYLFAITTQGLPYIKFMNAAGGTVAYAVGAARIDNDVWRHMVATFDGSTARLYVNGTQVDARAATVGETWNTATTLMRIGHQAAATYFNGSLDEVAIWDHALTASEIMEMYRIGAGLAH